jgi:hypothetical protein
MYCYTVDDIILARGATIPECWANCERAAFKVGATDDASEAELEARIAAGPTDRDQIGIECYVIEEA